MTECSSVREPFNLRLPLLTGLVTFAVLLPITVYNDLGQFFFILLSAPFVGFVLLVVALTAAVRRNWMRCIGSISMLAVYCAVSSIMFMYSAEIRAEGRWALRANEYKAGTLAQDTPKNGELKHLEWDVFGWVGTDNFVYLVYDPNDSLAASSRRRSSGKFDGIPCEVPHVHRLERHWYFVRFYTNSSWEQCN